MLFIHFRIVFFLLSFFTAFFIQLIHKKEAELKRRDMSSSGKRQSTEAPTKRIFSKFLSRKKKDKEKGENGKKQSTEGINNKKGDEDDAAGMRTCEEVVEGGGGSGGSSGSPMSIKQKRKKKKKDGKEATVEEDETVKGKKSKDKEKEKEKDKDDLKTAKRKKGSKSGKRERTEEAAPQPSGMATVFEAVKAPSRPAVAHGKDINEHIKEDMERIDKEEKEKEKQQKPIDEFAPTVFEPVQAQSQPAVASGKVKKQPRQVISPDPDGTTREKPMYGTIPKENAVTARERKDSHNKKVSAESTTTGKERSNKAAKHSDSQDDGADCKTAMIPASAVKVGPYQMVMYRGVPRYEPVNKSARPYEKSEKEVAAKIQILQPPTTPTSPTLPADNNHNYNQIVKTPPKSPPNAAASPGNGKNCGGGIVIGTLPKDPPPPTDDPKKDGPAPVSQYVAPLDR